MDGIWNFGNLKEACKKKEQKYVFALALKDRERSYWNRKSWISLENTQLVKMAQQLYDYDVAKNKDFRFHNQDNKV